MSISISPAGLKLIERFEGYRGEQYKDAVGVPTIGYGTTASVIDPLPETCTEAEAEEWLKLYVDRDVIPAIESLGDIGLNQNQIDALCSFGYNLGSGEISGDGSLADALRAKDFDQASEDFLLYDHAGGEVLEGLKVRREAERALFDTPVTDEVVKASGVVYFEGSCNLHENRWTIRQFPGTAHYGNQNSALEAEIKLTVDRGGAHQWSISGEPAGDKLGAMTNQAVDPTGVAHFAGTFNLGTNEGTLHRLPGTAHYGVFATEFAATVRLEISENGRHHDLTINRIDRVAAK